MTFRPMEWPGSRQWFTLPRVRWPPISSFEPKVKRPRRFSKTNEPCCSSNNFMRSPRITRRDPTCSASILHCVWSISLGLPCKIPGARTRASFPEAENSIMGPFFLPIGKNQSVEAANSTAPSFTFRLRPMATWCAIFSDTWATKWWMYRAPCTHCKAGVNPVPRKLAPPCWAPRNIQLYGRRFPPWGWTSKANSSSRTRKTKSSTSRLCTDRDSKSPSSVPFHFEPQCESKTSISTKMNEKRSPKNLPKAP